MKRVLLLVPSMGMGGMERVCVNYANLLIAAGYDVTLLNLTFDDAMIIKNLSPKVRYTANVCAGMPHIKNAGAKNLVKGRFRLRSFLNWLKKAAPEKLYRSLITDNPNLFDIEIAFYGGNMMRILSGSVQQNSLKIGWIHSPTVDRHRSLFSSQADFVNTYRGMDMLICVSGEIQKRAKEMFGNDVNAVVLHNPNDTKLIRAKAQEKVEDLPKKGFTFINASRLDIFHKGFDRLIGAVKRLKDEGFAFYVWILGDGKDREAVERLIAENGLTDRVILAGAKTNPYKYIRAADCYICSSRHEGFSMVVAETVILGTPVISTDISGAREMLGDSEFGLVEDNSEEGIYSGMKRVLSDTAYFRHLQEQAAKRTGFLNEEKIIRQLEAYFDSGFKHKNKSGA